MDPVTMQTQKLLVCLQSTRFKNLGCGFGCNITPKNLKFGRNVRPNAMSLASMSDSRVMFIILIIITIIIFIIQIIILLKLHYPSFIVFYPLKLDLKFFFNYNSFFFINDNNNNINHNTNNYNLDLSPQSNPK